MALGPRWCELAGVFLAKGELSESVGMTALKRKCWRLGTSTCARSWGIACYRSMSRLPKP